VSASPHNEEEAMQLMKKAQLCSNSETCSIDEAEYFLQGMLSVQGGCAAGTLQSSQICDDILLPSEIIGSLRDFIKAESQTSPRMELMLQPVFLTLAAAYIASGIITSNQLGTDDSFTLQEWMYATRDGYLGSMLSQFFKHGGLVSLDNPTKILPFTMQEWSMATRDGYLQNMIPQFLKYGGLTVSDSLSNGALISDSSVVVPFTPQEWAWSIKDGYFGDMLSYNMKHAGLMADNTDLVASSFTTQEWATASKDGYLNNMIDHYMRNGGI